jgi:hypothetical protein
MEKMSSVGPLTVMKKTSHNNIVTFFQIKRHSSVGHT